MPPLLMFLVSMPWEVFGWMLWEQAAAITLNEARFHLLVAMLEDLENKAAEP